MTMWRHPGPPFGFWSNGPYGTGAPIFFEDAPFGTYVAPTAWLSSVGERPRTAVRSPVRGTAFDRWTMTRVACGTRRSVAVTAVGPSVML